jgi:hypothetical protein
MLLFNFLKQSFNTIVGPEIKLFFSNSVCEYLEGYLFGR